MMVGREEELEDLFFNCIWISDFPYFALGDFNVHIFIL